MVLISDVGIPRLILFGHFVPDAFHSIDAEDIGFLDNAPAYLSKLLLESALFMSATDTVSARIFVPSVDVQSSSYETSLRPTIFHPSMT